VVAGDPFNSDPDDPEVQSDEVRRRKQRGDELPVSDLDVLLE
jgi:magnesium chelatase subunit I